MMRFFALFLFAFCLSVSTQSAHALTVTLDETVDPGEDATVSIDATLTDLYGFDIILNLGAGFGLMTLMDDPVDTGTPAFSVGQTVGVFQTGELVISSLFPGEFSVLQFDPSIPGPGFVGFRVVNAGGTDPWFSTVKLVLETLPTATLDNTELEWAIWQYNDTPGTFNPVPGSIPYSTGSIQLLTAVPLPAGAPLVLTGIAGFMVLRRRRNRA